MIFNSIDIYCDSTLFLSLERRCVEDGRDSVVAVEIVDQQQCIRISVHLDFGLLTMRILINSANRTSFDEKLVLRKESSSRVCMASWIFVPRRLSQMLDP